jgi:putative PIN family toxin of toxin-antitoxin system
VSQPGVPRVVFDCMVFLQTTARPGGPAARLFVDFVEAGRLTLFVSDTILAEVQDVLARPRIRAKNPAITDDVVNAFRERVEQVAQRIDPVPSLFILPRDPDDEPYLNLAIATRADYLVTRDNDMLDLMQDAAFRAQYPTLTILDPVALLHILHPPIVQRP